MIRLLPRTALILSLIALSACATVDGLGKDISEAGKVITKTAS